jgi:[protein-PII] uridylyltransferase
MSSITDGFRNSVVQAKQNWGDGRAQIQEQHQAGATGKVVTRQMSDLLDSVLIALYQSIIADLSPDLESRVALVLLGGCGRQDIAPYSDVDLMVLYQGTLNDDLREFSKRVSQDVTDSGLPLGYSLRTPREACSMSLKDAVIFSSITEARFLIGSRPLFDNFVSRFQRLTNKNAANLTKAIVEARKKERREFGETVYLLRPNIKRSRGGLRDIHLIRWLGFVRFGVTDIQELLKRGGISTTDTKQLMASQEFLLQIRNEMHFHAGRAHDGLGRNEQVRLAELLGYSGDDALLSVETFMRDYFRYTSRITYISDHLVAKMLNRNVRGTSMVLSPLLSRQIDEHYIISGNEIGISKNSLNAAKHDLELVLRLMQLACLHDKKLQHDTWIAIRHAMLKFPDIKFTREAARMFMALLSNTQRLGGLLRRLHETQVLQQIIPGFKHVRGLLQFNEYHMYTVDEHSLRAVENAIAFERESSVVGRTYRNIKDKNLLHLALLLHDLGKGFPEDHSIVGERIAEKTGIRLDLPDEDIATIKFLVRHHLLMSHIAMHRDINDLEMVAEFASKLGSVNILNMLFVLTCADVSAVGPEVLTPWKMQLLTDLFHRCTEVLAGDGDAGAAASNQHVKDICQRVAVHGKSEVAKQWLLETTQNLPNNYLQSHSAEDIASRFLPIRTLKEGEPKCWIEFDEKRLLYRICLANLDRRRSGNFYRLTGLLSSLGLKIRSADIKPLSGPIMFFAFQFQDTEHGEGELPTWRTDEIKKKAVEVLTGQQTGPPKFRKKWGEEETRALQLSRPEINVKTNNRAVNHATIIDVFAFDKPGLLYQISKKIYRLGLDVTYARISTYAHQIIDVFYVTDEDGNKIRNQNQLQIIRNEIKRAVTDFLDIESSTDNITSGSSS